MHTLATLSEELVALAERDPHVIVTLLRFCVGPRMHYWLHVLPLHWGAQLAERNDRLTLNTIERLLHGFALQRSSSKRLQV